MSKITQHTTRLVFLGAMTCIFAVGSFAQSTVNEIVRAQSTGNDFNIFIDPYALELFGDSVIGSMNADADASWNTWKDVLTNGNSPGMDVNFDGNTAYGIDSLLVAGAAELDSTLRVDGYVRFSDSLYVALYAYFAANLEVAGNADVTGALTVTGTASAASGSTVGNLTLADGSITDSSGAISFGDENLSTTGTAATGALTVTGTGSFTSTTSAASGSTVGNLTLADGSITDSSGAISFGDENLSTTGTLTAGVVTAASTSSMGTLTFADGSITDSSGAISFGDEDLSTTGDIDISAGTLTLADDQISGDKVEGGTIAAITISQLSGAMDANSQAMTNVNIDSGNIDGATIATSDVTVGAGKTLDVSAGTLTLTDDQISGDKVEGGTIAAITISQLSGAMDANSQAMTNVNIDSGNIDGATIATSDVTVGAGKTLDVSAGTLTLTDDQISGDKVEGGTIAAITISQLSGAMDANNQAMTNMNIDSGAIDGTPIGANTASTVAASTLTSGNATFSGTLDVAGTAEFNGKAKFDGNIGTNQSEAPAVYIGLSAANDPQIQLQGTAAADRPHIDFANAASQDADARLILMGDDDFQFAGTNVSIVGNYGLEVSGNAGVDGDFDVNTSKFTVAGSSGNTSVAGTLDVAGASTFADAVAVNGSVEMNDAVDINADLDADGADFDLDATNDISLDAGAASNFTTSAGALTLEGAGGVTVTSTGGTLALNGAGQTVDLDAATLDIDATTVTVDATTTTFTGDVKGPKATGDDEFVTYWQLDSLANTSPYHESVMIIKKGNTAQSIIDVNGLGHDPSVSFADNPSLMFEFESDASENGDFIDYPLGPDYLQVNQTGVYTVDVSMELATSSPGMFPVTLVVRNTDALDIASQQDVELAASTVWVSANAAPSFWVSTTMTVIMDNVNEKLHMDLLPYGGNAEVISYKFVVSRIGAE